MELKSIETGLEIVGLIVKNWRENDRIDEIEKALVIKKLKELSETVNSLSIQLVAEQKQAKEQLPDLFAQIPMVQSRPTKQQAAFVENTSFSEHKGNEDSDIKNDADKPDFDFISDPMLDNGGDMEIVSVDYGAESAMKPDFEFVPFADEQPKETEKNGVEEQPKQTDSDEKEAGQATVHKEKSVVVDKHADSLLATDENIIEGFHKRHKIDRKTIDRLYGDDSVVAGRKYAVSVENNNDSNAKEGVTEDTVLEEDFTLIATPQSDVHDSEPIPYEDAAVLGDVLNAGRKVLGDAWGNAEKSDVSSVASGKLKSLHSAIGINDIFLIAKDLFDSDVKKCEEVLNELEQMQNIDDALLYIHDNYKWDKNREGTKLIIDVLMRKLM